MGEKIFGSLETNEYYNKGVFVSRKRPSKKHGPYIILICF